MQFPQTCAIRPYALRAKLIVIQFVKKKLPRSGYIIIGLYKICLW